MKNKFIVLFIISNLLIFKCFAQIEVLDSINVKGVNSTNTKFIENSVNITKDGKFMTVASTRPDVFPYTKDEFNLHLFYRTDINSENWEHIGAFDRTINKATNEDYGEIKNGAMLYEHWPHEWKEEGGPFYIVEIKMELPFPTIGTPRPIGSSVNQFMIDNNFEATDGMTLLEDNSIIFAAGPNYNADMDIFYAKHIGEWKYEYPKPLSINTAESDERTPFISGDNGTLYFASNRVGSNGGLDIYKSLFDQKINDTKSNFLEHLSTTFNTEKDEKGFVAYTSNEAYFVRNEDIYRVTGLSPTEEPINPVILIEEEVADNQSQENVEIIDKIEENENFSDSSTETIVLTDDNVNPANNLERQGETVIYPSTESVPDSEKVSSKQKIEFTTPNNLVFVLDISNTMDNPDKFPLMKNTIKSFLPHFREEQDIVSVIAFNNKPIKITNRASNEYQVNKIASQLDKIQPKGSTLVFPALEKAFIPVSKQYSIKGNNVVILATDGKFGDTKKFKGLIKKFAKNKVKIVILCYGTPSQKVKERLQNWADKTGGFFTTVDEGNADDAILKALNGRISYN